jgi:hypothetical protein
VVRADQERDLVRSGRAGLTLSQLGSELALAQADPMELGLDRRRERPGRLSASLCQALREVQRALLGLRDGRRCRLERIGPALASRKLVASLDRASQELGVGLAPKTALRIGDPLEPGLDLFEPVRLCVERVQEASKLERRFPQAQLGVAQVARGAAELGRDLADTRQGTLRPAHERRGALAVLGCQRVRRLGSGLRELGHMPEPLALSPERVLAVRLEPIGVLDEGLQLREPRRLLRGACAQLLVAPAGRAEGTPGRPQLGPHPELVVTDERVEDVELVRGPGEPALLELARHR